MNEAERRRPLSRVRLVEVAFELVWTEGLAALTMRGLAERLGVKTASLYWHVRDRDELVALMAATLLAEVRLPRPEGDRRSQAIAICSAVERALARRRDSARIVLEVPEALERCEAHSRLRALLGADAVAAAAATMMLVYTVVASARGTAEPTPSGREPRPLWLNVDTGSRGVTLRAGSGMTGLIRVAQDPSAPAPAVVRGDTVVVRRLRGAGRGELELNPQRAWSFRIQAPTWNTFLDVVGLDVREIHIDSGASRVECALPPPRGMVPIKVSGGVVGVRLRRPRGVKVVVDASTAAVQLRLDDLSIGATKSDLHWESAGPASSDRYVVKISGGAVRVSVEEDPDLPVEPLVEAASAASPLTDALELVLDGIERRR